MYEGFSNEPTWMVSNFINNDASVQEYWLATAATFRNRNTLANKLCDKFRGQAPRLKGFHADLFEYAIGQIVWTEVAEELLDKLNEMEG